MRKFADFLSVRQRVAYRQLWLALNIWWLFLLYRLLACSAAYRVKVPVPPVPPCVATVLFYYLLVIFNVLLRLCHNHSTGVCYSVH